MALVVSIHFFGVKTKLFRPACFLNPSNSRGLKFGLYSCSQNPSNSIVLRFRSQFWIMVSVLAVSLYCSFLSLSISLPPYLFVCLPFSSCSYLSHLCCSHAARHCSSSNFSLLKFLIKINFETQKTLGGVPGPSLPVIYHYYYY